MSIAPGPSPVDDLIVHAPRTFFGAPRVDTLDGFDAQVAFLGVPYDAGTLQPWIRTGQSAGPASARTNSINTFEYEAIPGYIDTPVRHGSAGWFDIEAERDYLQGITMADVGDVAIIGAEIDRNLERITAVCRTLAEAGSLVVAVGGDHSISFPVGRGMEPFGPIDVVHIDAHSDFADEYDGARFTHGSQLRRLSELPYVRSVTAIGLRNVERKEFDDLRRLGANFATSLQVIEDGPIEVVRRTVPESERLYVSIDLDVLDLPLVTGTTLPEPGGLSYRELRAVLVEVARRGRVIGFDIVELNPPYDQAQATSRVTAWLITHFLSEIFDRPR